MPKDDHYLITFRPKGEKHNTTKRRERFANAVKFARRVNGEVVHMLNGQHNGQVVIDGHTVKGKRVQGRAL